ncbi:adenine deaminase [Acetivibrio ethanolgignens]|uniref:Adenine deaminase n=1 Tax=Acetivibrio ethanolgignens TaxID=290052 RepID=A0A0V8QEM6_9FIRM|nr:adenine deaminase [Acetivibrio ethanolgignens]KSV58862.1 adenosine deaminase [Acetivibrio ethanolgignens]
MEKRKLLLVAEGKEKADLVLKGGRVLNVFTNEFLEGDVAVCQDTIVGIGQYEGIREIDCRGRYIVPGYFDAHVHIESTLAMPGELSKAVLKSGTTTLIADPHELVNVKGKKALDFLLAATENVPLNVYIMIPSSVPATPFDTNGAGEFMAEDMEEYLKKDRILGLGEVMCFTDVVAGEEKILDKLSLFEKKHIDGHAPGLSGGNLQAYRLSGVENDHECSTIDEVKEKLRAGLSIFIREGSGAKNLEPIVSGMLKEGLPFSRCAFCTDDKHLEEIEEDGHISVCVRKAIALGMEPAEAYKTASWYPASAYGLKHLGAVAPGYQADLVVLEDVKTAKATMTLYKGIPSEEYRVEGFDFTGWEELLHTVEFPTLTKEKLIVKKENKNHVLGMIPKELLTEHLFEEVPGENGVFLPDAVYNKLCVVERHGKNGNVSAAPIKGFGIKNGAVATSVSHDSHNIIAAGDNDEDIIAAVNYLKEIQGGYVLASGGKVVGAVPLAVCGLLSKESKEEIQRKAGKILSMAKDMGVAEGIDPFITLSFMALPVIPKLRLLDTGLFDVEKFEKI